MATVAAFTDTYLPTVNGVTYTITSWRRRWRERGRRMYVVYPGIDGHDPGAGEFPVRGLPFPFYDEYAIGIPRTPREVAAADIVHVHTPFFLGYAGARFARRNDHPLVASYHTPTGEYAEYLVPMAGVARFVRRLSQRWERWFFDAADRVLVPSETTRDHLRSTVGVSAPVEVLSNGVDTAIFRPVDTVDFRSTHDLPDGPLVGYTGRHGYEKRLRDLVDAAAGLGATVVFGGDGPARADLERRAAERDVDVRFLGYLNRETLPAFYATIDVFAFPSPVETEGIVALEAMACGTPVVGARAGALASTIDDDVTGYHFPTGDVEAFRDAIRRGLAARNRLSAACLDRREEIDVERTLDRLEAVYDSL